MHTQIILVDKNDTPTGSAEKMDAHRQGLLHRAFSVFVYRKNGDKTDVLLQQRHLNKYHSGGLWTNTCCSHPAPGETVFDAATRRLKEETGLQVFLTELGTFQYRAELDNNLIENEIDHVLAGEIINDAPVKFNPEEIMAIKWMDIQVLQKELDKYPQNYTAWLPKALEIFIKHYHFAEC